MLFPIGDDNSKRTIVPYVTWGLIAANILVFVYELAAGDAFINGYSVIPREIVTGTDLVGTVIVHIGNQAVRIVETPGPPIIYLTLFTSMFMHAGFMHIGGNMLFLWVFGDNVEDAMGHIPFLIFYLLCGLVASFAQIAIDPQSVIPNLGASGAIAGVLGAYIILDPRNRVRVLVLWYILTVISVPAVVVIGFWFITQLFSGVGALTTTQQSSGVAFFAHIGGFVAGMVLVFLFRRKKKPPTWQMYNN